MGESFLDRYRYLVRKLRETQTPLNALMKVAGKHLEKEDTLLPWRLVDAIERRASRVKELRHELGKLETLLGEEEPFEDGWQDMERTSTSEEIVWTTLIDCIPMRG